MLVDDRTGSKELLTGLRDLGVPASLERLNSADFAFSGNGHAGPILIGVERKTIYDLIQSLRSGRLVEQYGRLMDEYDKVALLVEGIWRPDRTGLLEILNGKWSSGYGKGISYGEVASYLDSLSFIGGVYVVRTSSDRESCHWLAWAYKWFQKEWDAHRTFSQLHQREIAGKAGKPTFRKPSTLVKVAAQLPGIDSKAWDCANPSKGGFKSIRELANADEKRWEKVAGIGKKGAETLVRTIKGDAF